MAFPLIDRRKSLRTVSAVLVRFALLSLVAAHLMAQGPLRVYVLRSGDDVSDAAVVQALTERGHTVDLGVRANQLDFAAIQFSTYHVVVAMGVPGQAVSQTA